MTRTRATKPEIWTCTSVCFSGHSTNSPSSPIVRKCALGHVLLRSPRRPLIATRGAGAEIKPNTSHRRRQARASPRQTKLRLCFRMDGISHRRVSLTAELQSIDGRLEARLLNVHVRGWRSKRTSGEFRPTQPPRTFRGTPEPADQFRDFRRGSWDRPPETEACGVHVKLLIFR